MDFKQSEGEIYQMHNLSFYTSHIVREKYLVATSYLQKTANSVVLPVKRSSVVATRLSWIDHVIVN